MGEGREDSAEDKGDDRGAEQVKPGILERPKESDIVSVNPTPHRDH